MKIFRNRTVIGVLCILLALIICFGVTPLFSRSASEKTEIVRVTKDIKEGDEITAEMVQTVEVGAYNLPQNLMTDKKEVVGKYATADLAAGDYILSSKLSAVPAAENAYLYNLDGKKQAISVTIKSFATGLSGKLESGDIVTVIVADYQGKGETAIPPELQYVEVISVTASSGYDANTGEVVDEKELPSTVTLLVTTEQAMVLHVSPRELSDSLFSCLTAAPGSIRADINETTKRKKAGFLRREITEAQAVLAASGRADRFPMVCFTSLLCFALGAYIAIAAGNAFLVPVLAVGLMLTPFWYVKLTAGSFKKDVAAELETALSVITTAYLRTENFQQAVEENVRYLHPPVQEVFQHFLMRIKHIDPDMDAALTDLKAAIDNEVWREWCDAVMACQADRSLTSILTPIVSKLSDMRVVNAELENLVFGPRKEFITMAILVLINIPLVRFINKDWYHTLVATIPGQMVIAVCLAAVFVSFAFVVKLTQPIEYRR